MQIAHRFYSMTHTPETGNAIGRMRPSRAKMSEHSVRLGTGLILFAYATSHLVNHSFGMISLEAMQGASKILIDPWRSYPGLIALYGSFVAHGSLGLYALYRRRHVRIPRAELWQ